MLKRFSVALAALFVLASSAFGAGTLPGFSLSQQMGKDGKPLAGCVLKFYQAGTVGTPQTAYQDSGLTIPVVGGSQLTCDTYGRLAQFFLADGSIKIILTDVHGVTQVTADGLLVIGASSGGGGGSPVDPTTILATGDIKTTYGTGVLSGFVRANGRTIGSATSGATERANSDCQTLFSFLWPNTNLPVSGGRGASAAADWAANKTIVVPDFRGRAMVGMDDMGNSAAGVLTTAIFGGDPTILGASGGNQTAALATTNLPPYTPAGTNSVATLPGGRSMALWLSPAFSSTASSGGINTVYDTGGQPATFSTTVPAATFTGTAQGGTSTPFAVVQPSRALTFYMKL